MPSSSHPSHITRNIPYSLGYRLLRICSDPSNFSRRLEELKQALISRKDEALNKVKKIDRKKALEKVQLVKEQETPLITKFHPNLPSWS